MVSNRKYATANSKVVQKFEMVIEEDKKTNLLKILRFELEEIAKNMRKF